MREDRLGASTFVEKGWSLIAQNDYVRAEESLRKAVELAPRDAQGHALLAWALMHQNKLDSASEAVAASLKLQPMNPMAHAAGGYIAMRRGDFVGAIRYLTLAANADSDPKARIYANLYLGVTYLKREMYTDAPGFLSLAIALGPNLIEGYYYLGRALYRTGHPEEAKDRWRAGSAAATRSMWGRKCTEILAAVEAGKPFPHPL